MAKKAKSLINRLLIFFAILVALPTLLYPTTSIYHPAIQPNPDSPKDAKASYRILSSVTRTLESRYDAFLLAHGIGGYDNNNLTLHFAVYRRLSKDTLRKMLVESVDLLLTTVNADEEAQQCFKKMPLTEKEVVIVFTPYPVKKKPTDIYYATARRGNIIFVWEKPDVENEYIKESETFEETCAIVKKQELGLKGNL